MILHLLRGNVPTLNGVALRAVRPELAAMDVCVAIGAIFADIGENGFCVAESAGHFFMHASEWVCGFIVIEFRYGTNGPPAGCGVAIFAGNGKRAMGIASGLILRSGEWATGNGSFGSGHAFGAGERQHCPKSELEQCERENLPTPRRARIRRGAVEKLYTVSGEAGAQNNCTKVQI